MVRALSVAIKFVFIVLPVSGGLLLLLLSSFSAESGLTHNAVYTILSERATLVSTLLVAVVAPLMACYLALWLALGLLKLPRLQQLLSPVLSVPHVAFAVGLMLLFSPSGWLIRLVESVTGLLPFPPQGWPLPEKSVITVMVALVLKELPFLLLMIAAQLKQVPASSWLTQAQSYGYSQRQAWWRIVTPELLKRLTLPMAAVIIYSLSVVDIPLLVGSNTEALLAQRVYEWTFQFSPESQSKAVAGAWILMVIAVLLLFLNSLHSGLYRKWALTKALRKQWSKTTFSDKAAKITWITFGFLSLAIIVVLILQGLASSWFYPTLMPEALSLNHWQSEWHYLTEPSFNSLWLALTSALLGVIFAVVLLQHQREQKQKRSLNVWVLIALFVPQVPLVLGWQMLLGEHLTQGWNVLWVAWSHTVYTLPYAYLVLHGAYTQFDDKWLIKAQSLGYSARQAWWKVMLPMLKAPLTTAFAIAFAVSIAQYLPTQWLGQGLTPTLTTEAVSVASGGDWRIGSLYALLQSLLPLIVFIGVALLNTELRRTHSKAKRYAEHS
ncbi:ABC transporter permease [Idiomarina piscisalsi]|uniref:ABC transporter permease n=1 Tax=Idiomarina piscisalsi TaxID=1096243 RepID=A0A432YHM3_9GAMM|nr:ABC transporter permease subunit [Idiomarina piscisalsi]RUO60453.1 ABC transporter permease [Idiomarina piscisalsi]